MEYPVNAKLMRHLFTHDETPCNLKYNRVLFITPRNYEKCFECIYTKKQKQNLHIIDINANLNGNIQMFYVYLFIHTL